MKKWYRNSILKAFLIGLAHVVSVVLIVALLWILACPSGVTFVLSGDNEISYSDTEAFSEKAYVNSIDILSTISQKNDLETDGKIDKTKIVDVLAYYENSGIINKNESGIAYTIDELIKWADAIDDYECDSAYHGGWMKDPIIVCQKEDGSYDYYYYTEFSNMVKEEELHLVLGENVYSEEELLRLLKDGNMYIGEEHLSSILDNERRIKYTDCWNFDGMWIEELYVPQGAVSILNIVNDNPQWNGRLSEAFEMIYHTIWAIRDEVINYEANLDRWEEGNTNLSYVLADLENEIIYTNKKEFEDFSGLETSIEALVQNGKYMLVRPTLKECKTNMNGILTEEWVNLVKGTADIDDFVYVVSIDSHFPIPDDYAQENKVFLSYAPHMDEMLLLGIGSLVVLIVCIIWLTIVAGRNPGDEELHLSFWDKWKTELAAGLIIGAWIGIISLLVVLWEQTYSDVYYYGDLLISKEQFVIGGAIGAVSCACFLIGYLSLVRRIKARQLWKNSLTRSICIGTKKFALYVCKHIPSLWRIIIIFGVFLILHWIATGSQNGFAIFLMVAAEGAAFVWLMSQVMGRKKIRDGVERIANGDLDYKISLEHLHGQQLEMAGMVNNIGDGLQAAVEKGMRSERLKTDLITNVSHDIKTPLTSIINYIDLLKRENLTDPKVQGYLEVLEAKAQRLKTLTEDVLEASKVSSGNISLEKMNINLVEMIQQVSGEFEEKFKNRGLKEVLNFPAEDAVIYVDGRRMWRVLENIYNNAAKYAMEGTRVYADLKVNHAQVVFALKNISEQPLNIEAEELTERFIRGDMSRNTEGSGLGLSIAKNLTELQGGKFDIYLDGDLFKVTITFPKC